MPVRIRGFIRFQAKKHEDPTATHTKPVYVCYNREPRRKPPPADLIRTGCGVVDPQDLEDVA